MIAWDTETCGLDFWHGTKPFLVTMCDEDDNQRFWEWTVNPLTRQPDVLPEDVEEIKTLIASDVTVFHSGKFDAHALRTIGIDNFPWDRHDDTLLAAHLLASDQPHNLTDLSDVYLGIDIKPLENDLEKAVKKARDLAVKQDLGWRIATKTTSDLPSAQNELWRNDYWLPRALMMWWSVSDIPGTCNDLREFDSWWTVLSDYANADTAITIHLWQTMSAELTRLNLWNQYIEARKLSRVFYKMEERGVTCSLSRLRDTRRTFSQESNKERAICTEIATACGYDLELPKSGMSNSLRWFCWDHSEFTCNKCGRKYKASYGTRQTKCKKCKLDIDNRIVVSHLGLPVVATTETGAASLDAKTAIPIYLATLDGEQHEFIRALAASRKFDTAITYLRAYDRFVLPYLDKSRKLEMCFKPDGRLFSDFDDWYVMHPSNNQTGSKTLRSSQQNPNGTQISKQEDFTLRTCFGPAPGREWWSMDYQNIELRIPAYKAPEQSWIDLFERPDDPPYFGSNHLLNFSKVYADVWNKELNEVGLDKVGPHCKKKYASTMYQWCKNGGFALQYGCQEELADKTFRMTGAFKMLKKEFKGITKLNDRLMSEASVTRSSPYYKGYGYIRTALGYPLMVQRSEYGRPQPTLPLSYFVQGTAMECSRRSMWRVQDYLDQVNKKLVGGYYMILLVHDEIVYDFPFAENQGNIDVIKEIKRLMLMVGDEIGVPLGIGVEYHTESWAKGVSVKL